MVCSCSVYHTEPPHFVFDWSFLIEFEKSFGYIKIIPLFWQKMFMNKHEYTIGRFWILRELSFPWFVVFGGIFYFPNRNLKTASIHRLNHDTLVLAKFWERLNCGFFLHKKTNRKKMLEGLRLFLLQDYLHFKWWIMVFTTFWVYERFLILFMYIFCLTWFFLKPLQRPKSLTISRRRKFVVKNYVENMEPHQAPASGIRVREARCTS